MYLMETSTSQDLFFTNALAIVVEFRAIIIKALVTYHKQLAYRRLLLAVTSSETWSILAKTKIYIKHLTSYMTLERCLPNVFRTLQTCRPSRGPQ